MRGIRRIHYPDGCDYGITPACAGNTESSTSLPALPWDHPRVCGEYSMIGIPLWRELGSPPRVRGIHARQNLNFGNVGITPACAGNTTSNRRVHPLDRDHPRVCGEYSFPSRFSFSNLGSPPRVRGILFPEGISIRRQRITPACAGNTRMVVAVVVPPRDHPRVCGEYGRMRYEDANTLGSPPRVRGIRILGLPAEDRIGITPACAGNTRVLSSEVTSAWDHPRVCGEYLHIEPFVFHPVGSPPRVRGILHHGQHGLPDVRITPACAGNTSLHSAMSWDIWDHPRVCGEYLIINVARKDLPGSPPRVRGIRSRCGPSVRDTGITPACAGNTIFIWTEVILFGDHPRVCGEYLWFKVGGLIVAGSPPRVRGIRVKK